jgi:membrane-bound hydrogenase subunit beta
MDEIYTPAEVAEKLKAALGDSMLDSSIRIRAEGVKKRENSNIWITIQKEAIHFAVEELMKIRYPHLSCISGYDKGAKDPNLRIQYIFSLYGGIEKTECMVIISFDLPKADPHIPTITDLMEGAAFTEQEKREYLGIIVDGLPEAKHRFFLPQDFPKDIYPLRKDEKRIPDSMIKDLWACGRPENRPPAPLEDE